MHIIKLKIISVSTNLDSIASTCNSRSAAAPALLPNVPNDGRENGEDEPVGVLTASWCQLSLTFATVPRGGLVCGVVGSFGSTRGDALTHRLSASV